MPRKVFTAGEVLTAADTNTFLSDQVVMTFAGTAARGSAIPTPVEGMVTYLADTNAYEFYDGAAFVKLANPMTTEGDLITGGADGVAQRLGIGLATEVLTSNGTAAVWSAPSGGGDGELFWLVEANTIAKINLVIPANEPFLVKAYNAPAEPNPDVTFFDSGDVELLQVTAVTQNGTEANLATAVNYFVVANGGNSSVWIVITAPESGVLDDSLKIFSITTTQEVVLDRSYTAYVFGGGGGGGAIDFRSRCGGGGGGSGDYATGTVTAGTYTATIGGGGSAGTGGSNGGSGGSSSISGVSADGGSGGITAVTDDVGANGGAGGSGGGGGAGGSAGAGAGGFQGSAGSTGTGSGTNGTGGTGSGDSMPNPISALDVAILIPALSGATAGQSAGVYGGGVGGTVQATATDGATATAKAGGGGGANARSTSSGPNGGAGAPGIIILIESV